MRNYLPIENPTLWINALGDEKSSSYRHLHIMDKVLGDKKLSIISIKHSLLFCIL